MKNVYSILAFLTAGTLILTVGGCTKSKKSGGEREIRVSVMKLQKRTLRRQIPLQGTVMPVEYATISAKVSGTLEVLKVDEGDLCKAGDFLFGIDRQVLKNQVVVKEDEIKVKAAALKNSELELKTAEITCHQSQLDYDRAVTLRESKAISQANFETAETNLKTAKNAVLSSQAAIINAKAQLKQAESNLEIARKNLADSVIKAPFDCVIADKYVEENEYVTAGQDILKLENQCALEVVCYISAVYYHQITAGKTMVEFSDSASGMTGKGVVSYKSPSIDPESRTFKLKVNVPSELPLVSGMLCDLSIILEEKTAYALPSESILLRANNRLIAYTVNGEKRAESVEIRRGIVDGGFCEILNAEQYLDKVFVVTGQTFVNNGSLLNIVNGQENK